MKISIIIISSILLLLIDSVYLSYFGNFFNKQVEKVQGSPLKLNLWGAIFSYLFLIIGINYFILFSLVTYLTYLIYDRNFK